VKVQRPHQDQEAPRISYPKLHDLTPSAVKSITLGLGMAVAATAVPACSEPAPVQEDLGLWARQDIPKKPKKKKPTKKPRPGKPQPPELLGEIRRPSLPGQGATAGPTEVPNDDILAREDIKKKPPKKKGKKKKKKKKRPRPPLMGLLMRVSPPSDV